jgi:hypothetical protein
VKCSVICWQALVDAFSVVLRVVMILLHMTASNAWELVVVARMPWFEYTAIGSNIGIAVVYQVFIAETLTV